jgi:hypothetical protein
MDGKKSQQTTCSSIDSPYTYCRLVDRLVRDVGWLRGSRYIKILISFGISLLIGSSHMAHILNVKMGSKNLLYMLFKMRMEDKPYGINFELGVYL